VFDVVAEFVNPVEDLLFAVGVVLGGEVYEGGDLNAVGLFESVEPVLLYGIAFEAGVAEEGLEKHDVRALAGFPGIEGFAEELMDAVAGGFIGVVFAKDCGKIAGVLEGCEGLAEAAAALEDFEVLDELALFAIFAFDEEFELVEEVGAALCIELFGTPVEAELQSFGGTE